MKRICEVMDGIRGTPVCPETGEINLYYIIKKHIEDGIFQGKRKKRELHYGSEQGRVRRLQFPIEQ